MQGPLTINFLRTYINVPWNFSFSAKKIRDDTIMIYFRVTPTSIMQLEIIFAENTRFAVLNPNGGAVYQTEFAVIQHFVEYHVSNLTDDEVLLD